MSFFFFPFGFIITMVLISLFFRVIRTIGHRNIENRDYRNISRIPSRNLKISSETNREDFEVYIYRLAEKHNGRLTPARIVVDCGLPMKEIETRMESMVDNVHIRMEVDSDGRIFYEFPELREE